MTTLLITLIPSLFIIWYVVNSDKFKEPSHTILFSFFMGCVICFPAGLANYFLIWG